MCVVDHGVNEGEPVDEQYCEQANEDQFCDLEPEGQYFDQDLPEGFEDDKFNPALWCMFCPSFYKHNLLALDLWLDPEHPVNLSFHVPNNLRST